MGSERLGVWYEMVETKIRDRKATLLYASSMAVPERPPGPFNGPQKVLVNRQC